MPKEKKYRAWNGLNMEYGVGCSKYGCFYCSPDPKDSACLITTLYPPNTPIMEYIGMKDYDGIEIYEDDLLLLDDGQILQVIFDEEKLEFTGKVVGIAGDYSIGVGGHNFIYDKTNAKVIANIWESPKFLKENTIKIKK